ncbi:hypothetical protein GCM10010168_59140 [Actinoplanes ianthinogenes]|uniref:GtrA/DPMS transmembrane domain-containing protein n=1 Tax=Actinoplanes ianthinogenes TaxID=122358 RepID=A0ABM7M242_9ACTN|nr:hypothetical protein Aiant_63220 [Actinoplanes ianthinogenes]GGR32852.1 hypothetical protein GCM10010168_59140 [Actinoplanes ianthinogenes]
MPRQLFWFMLVGALSTVLQTVVYVSVREVLAATWASWLALLVVTPANTEAHRRITFSVTTSAIGRLHWEAGLTSVVVYLANLAVSPWLASVAGPHPSALTESMILALTGSLVGGARYLVLRTWVFAAHRHTPPAEPEPVRSPAPLVTTSPAAVRTGGPDTTVPRRTTPSRRTVRSRANSAPATAVRATPADTFAAPSMPAFPTTGNLTAALACLGTLAPIPTARLCTGQPNSGVLNQRPPGRLRTWHRNRRQHLTARS